MKPGTFAPGFRISILDALILLAGIAGAWWFHEVAWMSLVIGWVVGHFFLFCNVFRISRRPELIWAAVFVVLCAGTLWFGFPGWTVSFCLSLALTVVLVLQEMRRPYYHGVGWQRVNPELHAWWETRNS